MKQSFLIVILTMLCGIILLLSGCGLITEENGKEILDQILDQNEDIVDKPVEVIPTPQPTTSPAPTVIPTPSLEVLPTPDVNEDNFANMLYLPDNCSNPPKHLTANDGFKCMASSTRGGSIVCLLPYQFTWSPHKDWTDHHGVTMKCNKNDEHFDSVSLVLKSDKEIPLIWDKCQNWVGTADGKIGRQHWRAQEKWEKVKSKAQKIIMRKQSARTCMLIN